jgi:hypothetical protein
MRNLIIIAMLLCAVVVSAECNNSASTNVTLTNRSSSGVYGGKSNITKPY